jgi:site-specific recombinase XerD
MPLEPSTVGKELQTLRAFFRFLVDQDHAEETFGKRLRPAKESRRPTLPFSQVDIEALVKAASTLEDDNASIRAKTRRRAAAVVMTMLYSGLRISDVATLERKTSESHGRPSSASHEKAGEPVYVKLGHPALEALLA